MKSYFQNKDNWSEIARQCYIKFGCREEPTVVDIRKLIATVHEIRVIIDAMKRERTRTVRTPENIEAVAENGCESPSTSIRLRSKEFIDYHH